MLGVLVGGATLGACDSDRSRVSTEPLAEASALARADVSIASRLEAVGESRGWVRDGSSFTSPGWRAAVGNRWELLGARVSARADEGYEVGVNRLLPSWIKLVPIGVQPSEGRLDGGRLVYAGYARDVDRIVTSTRSEIEELFLLRSAAATSTFSWRVELPSGVVAAPRSDGSLSFEGARGEGVIQIARPYAVDARGTRRDARLSWDAPNRRLALELDTRELAFPVLLDPVLAVAAWQRTTGAAPTKRARHAMAYDEAHGKLVLFGGYDGTAYLADTWTYDGVNWTDVSPATSPSARAVAAMTYDGVHGEIVLFGGNGGSAGDFGDTWTWDGATWTEKRPAVAPSPRSYLSMAYDAARSSVVLFGGMLRPGGPATTIHGDTWLWDGAAWTQLTPAASPTPRSAYAMAYDAERARVILFGGSDFVSDKNQTYAWDGATWTLLTPIQAPSARSYASMAYDSFRKEIILFGGGQGTPFDETWSWNGANWTLLTAPTKPDKRRLHASAYDAGRNRVVVTGGMPSTTTYLADSWDYHSNGGACATGTDCATGFCVDGVCCESANCGACRACNLAGSTGFCAAVTNAPDPDSCAGAQSCDATGVCTAIPAATCTSDAQCATGHCADGVCCSTACAGQCEACDLPNSKGTCTPTTGAPRGARAACVSGATVCGATSCDGLNRKRCAGLPGAAVSCRPASCKDGLATSAASCNGNGACSALQTKLCAPFACGADACKTTCATEIDCAAGFACAAGKCVTPSGGPPSRQPAAPGDDGGGCATTPRSNRSNGVPLGGLVYCLVLAGAALRRRNGSLPRAAVFRYRSSGGRGGASSRRVDRRALSPPPCDR